MKSLLIIFNVAAEDDVCRLFLPYWHRSGCDLLFSSPHDAKSQLDGVLHLHLGKAMQKDSPSAYRDSWWWYQSRVLETMKAVVKMPYDSFIFTQYDSICLDVLPVPKPVYANFACGGDANFKSMYALHPPWGFTRTALQQFIETSVQFDIKSTEHGVMDRWIALLLQATGLKVEDAAAWAWTANSINNPNLARMCRDFITSGCKFVHGVKNASQLASILEP